MRRLLIIAASLLFTSSHSFAQCPSITVDGPAGVTNPGDNMIFRVNVSVAGPRLEYRWSVSAGTIIAGQGTPEITVATDRSMSGSNVTATAIIDGLPTQCQATAPETAPVAQRLEWESLDEWRNLTDNDQRSRLDSFFTELANYPHNTGLVILHLTKRERRDARNRRVQLVLDHAKFRQFDKSRIWFCLELASQAGTVLYRFPPGAEDDIPYMNCLILKGGDLK